MLLIFSINLLKVRKFDWHESYNIILFGTEGVMPIYIHTPSHYPYKHFRKIETTYLHIQMLITYIYTHWLTHVSTSELVGLKIDKVNMVDLLSKSTSSTTLVYPYMYLLKTGLEHLEINEFTISASQSRGYRSPAKLYLRAPPKDWVSIVQNEWSLHRRLVSHWSYIYKHLRKIELAYRRCHHRCLDSYWEHLLIKTELTHLEIYRCVTIERHIIHRWMKNSIVGS
jgi:hypothetical protein